MNNEEQLKIVISADTKKLQTEMDKAQKEVKEFGKVSEEQMEAFDDYMEAAKTACSGAMKAMGTAIVGAIGSMVALAESTREMRNNQAKLATAFESAGASAETATQVYDDLYRVLGDDGQATEAAAHLAKLTTNQKDLAEWTDIATGIYATFGDSLPLEGLTEAVNHTAQLGEVQGSLADALEWSGINVDAFNEELAQCNSVSEREKKIRDTLNKLYKTSADNYKKNNDAILKANDAQNRMNKSLSKMGEYMEPINGEVKELGATLLEDLEDPMKDISKYLTNSFFPAIKSTYGWLKDNIPMISSALIAMTTTYVGYKAAVLATEMAEKGLTVAIVAKTAAQKAFNTVMKANPIGLVATVLIGAASAMVAYEKSTANAVEKVQVLSDEELVLRDSALEARDAFYDQLDATEQAAEGLTAQHDHTTKLADELMRLADANGKVQEADQARVDFILGQLNEALGTEYSMVDGVIQKYDELETGIYEVINAKTASALLEAHNAAYIEAIESEAQALAEVSRTQREYEAQAELVAQKQKELAEVQEEAAARRVGATANEIVAINAGVLEKMKEVEATEKGLEEMKIAYDDALVAYGTHYDTKKQYEEAALLIEQGNYQEAINMLKGKSDAYFEYSDDVDEATQQAVDALYKEAVDAGIAAADTKQKFEQGVEGYTQEMVDEAEQGYEDALNKWADAYDDANGVGEDLGDGLADGMEDKRGSLLSKARNIVSAIISAMRSEADSHSPSRKTISLGEDMGEGAEIGIENTTKDVVMASRSMISDSLKAMRGISATNFTKAISGSIMDVKATTMAPRVISGSESALLLDALGSKISNNTPIILQVDGKTFAQTAINTINQQTRQTGRLALNII